VPIFQPCTALPVRLSAFLRHAAANLPVCRRCSCSSAPWLGALVQVRNCDVTGVAHGVAPQLPGRAGPRASGRCQPSRPSASGQGDAQASPADGRAGVIKRWAKTAAGLAGRRRAGRKAAAASVVVHDGRWQIGRPPCLPGAGQDPAMAPGAATVPCRGRRRLPGRHRLIGARPGLLGPSRPTRRRLGRGRNRGRVLTLEVVAHGCAPFEELLFAFPPLFFAVPRPSFSRNAAGRTSCLRYPPALPSPPALPAQSSGCLRVPYCAFAWNSRISASAQ
jgi:hypothetical protein